MAVKRRKKLGPKQENLLVFLKKNAGKTVSEEKVLEATGYKPRSFRVNFGNGHFSSFLTELDGKRFLVIAKATLSEAEFYREVSQTASHRELGAAFEAPLAKRLVQKSKDNFILALELYNRPSLQNRLDAFAQLFCTAWEQLLKAELLDQEGEEAIFKEQKEGRRRESISIDACIKKLMPNSKDFIRRNLERIVELRHEATHLLMEETALPISQLFQAGVLNFAKRFKASTGEALLPESSAGLLSLVGHVGMQNAVDMKKLYGEVVGADIEGLRNELDREIDEVNDQRFAVTIEYKLALVKKAGEGDISLSSATGSETILGVIEKSVLRETSHPHLTKDVINAVEIRLGTKFTSYDFTAILQKEKWKNGNNQYHSVGKKLTTHLYSDACIDEIISKVTQESDYLSAVRQSYRKFLKRKR